MSMDVKFTNRHERPVFLSVNEKDTSFAREVLLMPGDVFVLNATAPFSASSITLFHPPQPGEQT